MIAVILTAAVGSCLCRMGILFVGFCCPLWILGKCCGFEFSGLWVQKKRDDLEEMAEKGCEKEIGNPFYTKRWDPQRVGDGGMGK